MTRGSFAGFLPLVNPKTTPPGALCHGFCPWSALKQPHRGHFAGFLPLVKPESCPEVMFYGVFAFSGLFRGYVALILEDMGPGFWNIWVQDSGRYGTGFYSIWRQDSGAMGPLIGFSLTFNYLPRQYVHHN